VLSTGGGGVSRADDAKRPLNLLLRDTTGVINKLAIVDITIDKNCSFKYV
jgi:hypothetical protein